jgi:hypothetical protein
MKNAGNREQVWKSPSRRLTVGQVREFGMKRLMLSGMVRCGATLSLNSGFVVLNEVATARISFNSSCDGNAKVAGATGNYP